MIDNHSRLLLEMREDIKELKQSQITATEMSQVDQDRIRLPMPAYSWEQFKRLEDSIATNDESRRRFVSVATVHITIIL